jgi:hypothetical protein
MLGVGSALASDAAVERAPGVWRYGTELDVLPYATKGYYGSAFAGTNGWRFRGVAVSSTIPSFMVEEGYEDKSLDAYAFLVDRFLGAKKDKLEGFWIGGGGEYWRNKIRAEGTADDVRYDNFVLTVGGGYVWKLSRHFFINTWAGAQGVGGGNRQIPGGGKVYEQRVFTPEASVKFGITF